MAKTIISRIYDAHKIVPIRLHAFRISSCADSSRQELHMSRKNLHVYVISRKMVRTEWGLAQQKPTTSRTSERMAFLWFLLVANYSMTCVALSILSSPTFFRQWPIKLALMGCFYYGSPACKHMCLNLNPEFIEFAVIAMLMFTDIFNSIR